MKRTIHQLSYFVAGSLFILLVIKDFFPNISVNKDFLSWGILISVLTNIITHTKPILKNDKSIHLYIIFATISLLLLVIILTLLGGKSQSGITTHPIFWMLAIATIIKSLISYQKPEKNNPNNVM